MDAVRALVPSVLVETVWIYHLADLVEQRRFVGVEDFVNRVVSVVVRDG